MREIKFRFWDKKHRAWEKEYSCYGIGLDRTIVRHFDNDNTIAQQYTGLKDKDGVEIYEGDIIDNHEEYHNKKVVNYDPHSCFYCLIDLDEYPNTLYNGEMFNQAGEGSNFSGRIEVIGNIFEGVDK